MEEKKWEWVERNDRGNMGQRQRDEKEEEKKEQRGEGGPGVPLTAVWSVPVSYIYKHRHMASL